jgi:hypothetical protein
VERAIGTNASSISGGYLLAAGHIVGTAQTRSFSARTFSREFSLGHSVAGVSDTLCLAVSAASGANLPAYAVLDWDTLI